RRTRRASPPARRIPKEIPMTAIQSLVGTPLAGALGWALFHSIWQGVVAAMLLAAVVSGTRAARVRYAASWTALLAVVAAFGITLLRLLQTPTAQSAVAPLRRAPVPAG